MFVFGSYPTNSQYPSTTEMKLDVFLREEAPTDTL